MQLFTIDHGRHTFAYFLELLSMFEIEFVYVTVNVCGEMLRSCE